MTISLSWGEYGGFYVFRQHGVFRVCLGWLAFTKLPYELDDLMDMAAEGKNET